MAALRRLIVSFSSKTETFTAQKPPQTPSKATKAQKLIAAGASITAGAAYYYYYYYYSCRSHVGRRPGLKSHVEARLMHLALPSVSATDKVR